MQEQERNLSPAALSLAAPRVTGDGYYEASLLDPEGNLLELVA